LKLWSSPIQSILPNTSEGLLWGGCCGGKEEKGDDDMITNVIEVRMTDLMM